MGLANDNESKSNNNKNIHKFNIIKIKNFHAKKPTEWEKVSTSCMSDKNQVLRTYKELLQFKTKRQSTHFEKNGKRT